MMPLNVGKTVICKEGDILQLASERRTRMYGEDFSSNQCKEEFYSSWSSLEVRWITFKLIP